MWYRAPLPIRPPGQSTCASMTSPTNEAKRLDDSGPTAAVLDGEPRTASAWEQGPDGMPASFSGDRRPGVAENDGYSTTPIASSIAWTRLRLGRCRGTFVAMTTEALRTVKDRFSEYVDRVAREHERVVITKNGRPAAVLISTEDLDGLEETIAVLSDPDAMAGIRESDAAAARGDVVHGVEAVRALRPRRS
jgi:antitoxin YefM